MNAFQDGARGEPTIASGWPERLTMVWWLVFGTISVYWAAGGMWLVDTAVQERGVELARQRPAWFVVLVFATGLVKYAFALFAWVSGHRDRVPVPRWALRVFGVVSAFVMVPYGLCFFTLGLRHLLAGGETSAYFWMRLLVWMPQFWVGGLLILVVTARLRADPGAAAHRDRTRAPA